VRIFHFLSDAVADPASADVGCIFLILLWLYSTVTFFPAWVQTTLDLVETHAPWVIESLPFLGQASQSS